jgi:hypothetical protein
VTSLRSASSMQVYWPRTGPEHSSYRLHEHIEEETMLAACCRAGACLAFKTRTLDGPRLPLCVRCQQRPHTGHQIRPSQQNLSCLFDTYQAAILPDLNTLEETATGVTESHAA